jgi:hypothetical protein
MYSVVQAKLYDVDQLMAPYQLPWTMLRLPSACIFVCMASLLCRSM